MDSLKTSTPKKFGSERVKLALGYFVSRKEKCCSYCLANSFPPQRKKNISFCATNLRYIQIFLTDFKIRFIWIADEKQKIFLFYCVKKLKRWCEFILLKLSCLTAYLCQFFYFISFFFLFIHLIYLFVLSIYFCDPKDIWISVVILFTNPSTRTGYDTRSVFKRSFTGLNSVFLLLD